MSLIADVTAGNPVSASWGNAVRDGSIMQVTAAEKASIVPAEGQMCYVTDEDRYYAYNGTAWVMYGAPGAWVSWTPTWSGLTLGTGGTNVGAYCQTGKKVEFYLKVTLGTSPAFSGLTLTLPVGTMASRVNAQAYLYRGTTPYLWSLSGNTGVSVATVVAPATTNFTTAASLGQMSSALFAAAANDVLDISGWYVTT